MQSRRLSVIIPTHRRRESVLRTVGALAGQEPPEGGFEVVVVVDGPSDGTPDALEARSWPFPLRVVTQPHRGLAAARNHGVRTADGLHLVFLDDDMVCEPAFLQRVALALSGAADLVLTRVRVGRWVPDSAVARQMDDWFATLDGKWRAGVFEIGDVFLGAAGVRREAFERSGGFDEAFTAGGAYGAEDAELFHRLVRAGARVGYEPEAVAHTGCETDPRRLLGRARDMGRNHVRLARTHPELAEELFDTPFRGSRLHGAIGPLVRRLPAVAVLAAPLRAVAVRWLPTGRLWEAARAVAFWRGVAEARAHGRRLRVLCYHAVADLDDDPTMAEYAVTPDQLDAHLGVVARAGYRWVDLDTALSYLEGNASIPRRCLLLTFDDGYRDLAEQARPVLERHGVPAAVFVVSDRLGGTNDWDAAGGGGALQLLDRDELAGLARDRVAVGSHSRTHPSLCALDDGSLHEETLGSADALERAGLGRPAVFAYPHGHHDARVRSAVARAGYRAAFTVEPGRAGAGTDPFRIPRIEVHRTDAGWRFILKVASAGRSPYWEAVLRRRLSWLRPLVRLARRVRQGQP